MNSTQLHKAIYGWFLDEAGHIQTPTQGFPDVLQARKQYFTKFNLQPFTLMTYIFPEQEQINDIQKSFEKKCQHPWLPIDPVIRQFKSSSEQQLYEQMVMVAVIDYFLQQRGPDFKPQSAEQQRLWQSVTNWQMTSDHQLLCPNSQLPDMVQQRIQTFTVLDKQKITPFEWLMYIWPDPKQLAITKKFFIKRTGRAWPPVDDKLWSFRQGTLCTDYELAIMIAVIFGLHAKVVA
ncbi:hypothetical protein [Bombilactobacillus thymidiniphilus]|uniref:DUF2063 domain-containing protein n=1 Tax=Bombilactobacillus thymidiniphilus TaxID=2923363 RepID=A0ABY4PCZ5_9LACO|nr:hypothetical protein [Bombilactobacillus thymidiniphilus]UQS83519.1 hypothetical protein MOO47_07040 [Bombilactobacillus thymidiniphilus]